MGLSAPARATSADVLQRYQALLKISDVILCCRNLDELFHQLAESLRNLVAFDGMAVGLLDDEGRSLKISLLESFVPQNVGVGFSVPLEAVPGGWVVNQQRPMMWTAEDESPAYKLHRDVLLDSGLKASYHLPLSTCLSRLGELVFVFKKIPHLDEVERDFMHFVANQVALAIENAGNFQDAHHAQSELERKNDQAKVLLELTNSLVSNLELRDLLRAVACGVRRVVQCACVTVLLPDDDRKTLTVEALDLPQGKGILREGFVAPIEGSLAGRAFKTAAPVLAFYSQRENFVAEVLRIVDEEGFKSGGFIPIVSRGRSLGVLGFARYEEKSFTPEEVEFLNHVAGQVAVAIENALNFESTRAAQQEAARERDRTRLLLEVNNAVVAHLDLRELVKAISARLQRVLAHDAAFITLLDADGTHLRMHALDLPGGKFSFAEGLVAEFAGTPEGEAISTKKPVLVSPRIDFERFNSPLVREAAAGGIKTGCTVPLIAHGRLLGTLSVVSMQERTYTEDDATLLEQCSTQLAIAVENALAYGQIAELKDKLAQEKVYLEDEIRTEGNFDEIIGQSAALRQVLQLVETVAPSDSTVLLLGETGTGKELIARAIHEHSRRKGRTFVKLNCAAIPTGLLESELFGHEKGAFTGAIAQKVGRLELADQGTLFLDEVGDIPTEIQPKLLRALQEREFERLGSTHTKKVNVRLVAATNRDLEKMIAAREFRSDLYYRLNVFPIRIPPLRERNGDIPLLVRYFAQKYARQMQKKIDSIPSAAMTHLQAWGWPGNVRELENFIERAVILTGGSALHVPVDELKLPSRATPAAATDTTLESTEREHIIKVLRDTRGMLAGPNGAAFRLGLKRTTLQSKMKKLGITREHYHPN